MLLSYNTEVEMVTDWLAIMIQYLHLVDIIGNAQRRNQLEMFLDKIWLPSDDVRNIMVYIPNSKPEWKHEIIFEVLEVISLSADLKSDRTSLEESSQSW